MSMFQVPVHVCWSDKIARLGIHTKIFKRYVYDNQTLSHF